MHELFTITLSVQDVLRFLVGLITIFCPPVAISIYTPVAKSFSREDQRLIAKRMFYVLSGVLVMFACFGQILLRALGVTGVALSLTGGLVLVLWAIPMMMGQGHTGGDTHRNAELAARLQTDWRSVIAIPLVFPFSVGGASVSFIIAMTGRYNSLPDILILSLTCVVMAGFMAFTFLLSGPLSLRLGKVGMELTNRIAGILLTAIALQIVAQALRELFPGLAVAAN
jgi:multiple antibiotic resistance protein